MIFFPTKFRLQISYLLTALTLVTGTYLVLIKPVHILSTCIMGLVYVGFVSAAIISARHKLAKEINE